MSNKKAARANEMAYGEKDWPLATSLVNLE